MTNLSTSFSKLCHSYVRLADKFQQLDVEYMTLKTKIVPILKQLKAYRATIETLKQEKHTLKVELETITAKYAELQVFEELLSPEMQSLLEEAQDQVDLVDETLNEMDLNDDPDLTEEDKHVLLAFRENPESFALPDLGFFGRDNGKASYPNGSGHTSSLTNHEKTALI